MELITALKEGAAIPDARGEVVTEIDPDDDEEASTVRVSRRERATRPAGSSTTTWSFLSRLSQATKEAVASLGDPPPFEPLKEFFDYLEVEYGGIRRDRMRHIQDFQREKGIHHASCMRNWHDLPRKQVMRSPSVSWWPCTWPSRICTSNKWRIPNCYWPTEVGLH